MLHHVRALTPTSRTTHTQALPKPEEAEEEEEEAATEAPAGPIEPEELPPLRPVNEWTLRKCPAPGTAVMKSLKW